MLVMRLQRVDDGGVGGLLVAVAVEEQGAGLLPPGLHMLVSKGLIKIDFSDFSSISFDSPGWICTYSVVSDAPARDTNTVADVQARVLGLEVVGGRSTGNIELGDGTLGSSSAESPHGLLDTLGTGPAAAGGKVHLGADAVDGNAGGAPLLDVFDHTLSLAVVGNVKVVVVDVQLAGGVGRASSLEGNADVVLADDVEPVALPEGSVFVEDLVHHVLGLLAFCRSFREPLCAYPDEDLALVAAHDGPDVSLHHGNQSVLVVDLGDPARQLRVPNECVTTDELAVALGPVDDGIGTGELEVATRRLSGIELHGILGGDLTEVGLCDVAAVAVETTNVAGGAPVPKRCQYERLERFSMIFNSTYFLPFALKPASTEDAARSST
jgi:hypothetical protein